MQDTYKQILRNYVNYLRFEKRYSQHTIISYTTDLNQFFNFLSDNFEAPPAELITASHIRTWLADLKQQQLNSRSINRKSSCLKSLFKYMLKQGKIPQTPAATVLSLKTSKRLPQFVEEQDMANLFNNVEFPDNREGETARMVLLLLYNTGMRLSELINLKEQQVDFHYGHIKVLGKGNKERIVPLNNALVRQLKQYINTKPEFSPSYSHIFLTGRGRPLYPRYVYTLVKKNLSLVTTIQKKSPHVLRHSFATHLMNNGAELNAVKELLGHSSLAATQVYTHNSIEKLKEVFKKAHPKA